MDADLARSLLAGWIAGAMEGIVATGLVLVVMARKPGLAARIAGTRRLGIIGVILANGLTLTFTLIGLVLGALFHRAGGADAALRFALVVGGGSLTLAGLYAFVRGRVRTAEAPVVLMVLTIAALSFGVVLPVLGSLDR